MLNDTNNKLFWLASYPKSGNTWFRIFLNSLLNGSGQIVDINKLKYSQFTSDRYNFDEIIGFNSTDLSKNEIELIRSHSLNWLNLKAETDTYYKTHAAYTYNSNRVPVMGDQSTGIAGALYFVRNPLDVCISYAHHNAASIDETIEVMASKLRSHGQNISAFIPEDVLSWSENVNSWSMTEEIDVKVIRFEDMLNHPITTFSAACAFFKLDVDSSAIQRTLEHCSFKNLQAIETDLEFREKPPRAKRFFRNGRSGEWQDTLSTDQIERIVKTHGETMKRFGYLDNNGNPTVC